MKKVISLVMTAIVISSFVACGTEKEKKVEIANTQAIVNEENEILVNNSLAKVTLKSTSINSSTNTFKDKKVIIEVQNKSNYDIIFQTDNISINGYMEFTFNKENIEAGESKEIEIAFNNKNISSLENIEGNFIISKENDNGEVEVLKNCSFEALEKDKFFTTRQSSEKVLLNNNYVKITLVQKMEKPKGISDTTESPSVRIKIQNKTKKELIIYPAEISVNGEVVEEQYKEIIVGESETINDNIIFKKGTVSSLDSVKGKLKVYYRSDLTKVGDYSFTI